MGTRGLMGVRIDGQDKLSYCHLDSYPEGWPSVMVEEIRQMLKNPGLGEMRDLARAIKQFRGDAVPTPEDLIRHNVQFAHWRPVSTKTDWYSWLRGLHGRFRDTLELGLMLDSNDFIGESLFCEWAYIANFDEETFEVYQGFQTKPHSKGRFSQMPPRQALAGKTFYPCALVATFPLMEIPVDWDSRFLVDT